MRIRAIEYPDGYEVRLERYFTLVSGQPGATGKVRFILVCDHGKDPGECEEPECVVSEIMLS